MLEVCKKDPNLEIPMLVPTGYSREKHAASEDGSSSGEMLSTYSIVRATFSLRPNLKLHFFRLITPIRTFQKMNI